MEWIIFFDGSVVGRLSLVCAV